MRPESAATRAPRNAPVLGISPLVHEGAREVPLSLDVETAPPSASERLAVFLNLAQRKVVVVGGGNVAASKLPAIVAAGAVVTLIAPRVVPAAVIPGMTIIRRHFREKDLDGAWFVVAAATPAVNARVAHAACRKRIFVNAVDDPKNASAYFASILRRGDLTLAFSTRGKVPAMARLLREAVDDLLPTDLENWLELAKTERQRWLRERVPIQERLPLLAAVISRLYMHND